MYFYSKPTKSALDVQTKWLDQEPITNFTFPYQVDLIATKPDAYTLF